MAPVLKLLQEPWADPAIALPAYATAGAAGADIRANFPAEARAGGLTLAPMAREIVPTGLRVEIPPGFEMQIRPRSGLARDHGITLPNTPGTIDSDYRGPLGVLLVNLGGVPFTIAHGMRIAQMIVAPVVQVRFAVVDALSASARGEGGFGSTRPPLMVWVLLIAAGIWFLGRALAASVAARVAALAALIAAVLVVQLALPPDNPLRAATGGSARAWAVLLGAGGLAVAYVWGLRALRRRTTPSDGPVDPSLLSDAELDRYARHIVLREIGGPGQRRLKAARVLVVGAGGLGSPALLYLGAAGVGTLGVIDDDQVSVSNLQRQVIHSDDRLGTPKVFSAKLAIAALNPHVVFRPYNRRLSADIAEALFADYDLVLDGSDSFETRALVNRAAVAAGVPLISGAIAQWEGQLGLYDPATGGPCYACVFPEAPAPGLAPACAESGVVGALPGVIGAMMALEAIKHLTGAGQTLQGRLLLYDGLHGETRIVAARPHPDCPVCGGQA